jgi:hypothetical protein
MVSGFHLTLFLSAMVGSSTFSKVLPLRLLVKALTVSASIAVGNTNQSPSGVKGCQSEMETSVSWQIN